MVSFRKNNHVHHIEMINLLFISGVMRITVSVVVIMFELTGQITYILPTMVTHSSSMHPPFFMTFNILFLQIALMITRAVGDWFGSGGIADRYIRLNGYPILDNDEQIFNVPGKSNSYLQLYGIRG